MSHGSNSGSSLWRKVKSKLCCFSQPTTYGNDNKYEWLNLKKKYVGGREDSPHVVFGNENGEVTRPAKIYQSSFASGSAKFTSSRKALSGSTGFKIREKSARIITKLRNGKSTNLWEEKSKMTLTEVLQQAWMTAICNPPKHSDSYHVHSLQETQLKRSGTYPSATLPTKSISILGGSSSFKDG